MGPVVTLMGGRLDDWLKIVAKRDKLFLDPGHLEWAGVAALKRAYRDRLRRAVTGLGIVYLELTPAVAAERAAANSTSSRLRSSGIWKPSGFWKRYSLRAGAAV